MYCTVLRNFPGPAGMIEAGQVVDTSTWRKRNRDVLITRHYLREEPTYALTHGPSPSESEPESTSRQQRKPHHG